MLQLLLLAAALQLQLAAAGAHLDHDAAAISPGLAALIEQSRGVQAVALSEPDWIRTQARYEAEIECKVQHGEVLDAVFYGDSIIEALRGNFRGKPYSKAADQPAIWRRHFGSWNALALGISGDRTLNLLWRLREGGEAAAGLRCHTAVVLIGTNDFYNHHEQLYGAAPMSEVQAIVGEVVSGVLAVAAALQERLPRAHVLLLGLLPRGSVERGRWDASHWELPSMFSPHIQLVNERLAEFAAAARHVSFLDCGHVLLTPAGDALDPELVYDGLHPTAKGADALLACVKPHLQPARHRRAEQPDA